MKRILLLVILCLTIVSCGKPSSNQTNPNSDTAYVFVGGLGASQLNDIEIMIQETFVLPNIVTFGGEDDWKIDVDTEVAKLKYKKLVLIGHSYGTDTICRAKTKADAVFLIDPVAQHGDNITVPDDSICYWRTELLGPVRANLHGKFTLIRIWGDHNTIPHSPDLIKDIKSRLLAL